MPIPTATKSGPLVGVRVVDLTTTLMGPYCTQILADLGAEVTKVEVAAGDTTRYLPPALQKGEGGMFLNVNRGKRSVVLDLKQPAGREVMLRLVRQTDVFVHSMRARAMRRLRLSYADLQSERPDLVYANLYGFGRLGPYADLPAYDDVIQAASGLAQLQARLSGGPPAYVATAVADKVGGLTGAYAILAALLHRQRTGEGQELEVPMFETLVAFVMTEHCMGTVFEPPLGEPVYPRLVASDRRPYRTRDGYIAVMIYNDKQWTNFFHCIGDPAWSRDPCFRDMSTRTQHIDEVYGRLAQELAKRTTAEWLKLLSEWEIPAMPLMSTQELRDDPHLAAVGFWQYCDSPAGAVRLPGIPTGFSRTPARITQAGPGLGAQSETVLRELGYADDQIAALLACGAAGAMTAPRP